MARVYLTSSLKGLDIKQLTPTLEALFQQLEDQLNEGADLISITDANQKLPTGMARGDIVFDLTGGELRAGVYNGKEVFYASFGSFTGAITDAQHGTRAGGVLHPAATTILNGFMSAGDKTKIDHYQGDTSSGSPASLTEYPNDGDWGFHTNTGASTYKLAKNKSGTIFTVTLT